MTDNPETLAELLKDSIFINAVNMAERRQLKERIVRIAEKWSAQSDIIRKHSLNHD